MSGVIGVVMLFWIVRGLMNADSGRASGSRSTSSSSGTEISPALVALFVKGLLLPFGRVVAADHGGPIMEDLVTVVEIPILFPTLFLRYLLVPLGLYRLAYWWFRCTWPFGFGKEFRTGAVYYGALALARQTASTEQIEWLRRRLPTSATNTVAHDLILALFAALAGEQATARTMLNSIDKTRGPRWMRCDARDWLVANAASKGDWQEVVQRGRRGRDSFRWSYAMARMAERYNRSANAAPNWQLIGLWLLAPRRIRLLAFLRATLAVPRAPKSSPPAWPAPANLSVALADLGGMLQQMSKTGQQPEREHFVAIVQGACTQAESQQTRAHLQERLKVLDPLRSDALATLDGFVRAIHTRLVELVVPIIERSPGLIAGEAERPVLQEAIGRIRQSVLEDIEMRCRDFVQRTTIQDVMPVQAEWNAWALLQDRANHLLKLDNGVEDALFQIMYGPVCNFAVRQHNELTRHRLAHDMFLWLKQHANSNRAADEILTRNVAAYPLRWDQGNKKS